MTEKRLRVINQRFNILGRSPFGQLKFRWFRTTDLFYLVDCGTEEHRSPNGLYYFSTKYERYPFAHIYGVAFGIGMWQAPMPREEWDKLYGEFNIITSPGEKPTRINLPWPKHGEYLLIDSTVLPPGVEPDEDLTDYAIYRIHQELGMQYTAGDAKRVIERQLEREKRIWGDCVDDCMFAFDSIPGRKEHVSFPSSKRGGNAITTVS